MVVGGAGHCGLEEAVISAGVVSMLVGELCRVWLWPVEELGSELIDVYG